MYRTIAACRGCGSPDLATVLDLGAGMGFYGAVVRQWCDSGVRPWRTRLVGVENLLIDRKPLIDRRLRSGIRVRRRLGLSLA